MSEKFDRLAKLVAISVKNGWTPRQTGFADRIIRACSSTFATDHRTSKQYVRILVDAFMGDHWKGLLLDNEYLKAEEIKSWSEMNLRK